MDDHLHPLSYSTARAVAGMGFKGWGSDEERGSQHLRDSSRLVRIKKLEQEM